MKFITLFSISVFLYLQGCSQANKQNNSSGIDSAFVNYISQTDAEKILGQSAMLTDSSVEKKDNALKYRYNYTANDSTIAGNRTAHLYCMVEVYNDETSAKNTFADILSGNRNMPNLKKINIGDEALQHSDNENFNMIIVRKGNTIVRLKVNKLTSLTSTEELLAAANKITNGI